MGMRRNTKLYFPLLMLFCIVTQSAVQGVIECVVTFSANKCFIRPGYVLNLDFVYSMYLSAVIKKQYD